MGSSSTASEAMQALRVLSTRLAAWIATLSPACRQDRYSSPWVQASRYSMARLRNGSSLPARLPMRPREAMPKASRRSRSWSLLAPSFSMNFLAASPVMVRRNSTRYSKPSLGRSCVTDLRKCLSPLRPRAISSFGFFFA